MKPMKRNLLVPTLAALLLSATTLPSIAATGSFDLLGTAALPSAARSIVVLSSDTDFVEVTRGDIVKFVVGDESFTWDFNGADSVASFDLRQVAPPWTLAHAITVYVDPNPLRDSVADQKSSVRTHSH
jgi:hypothetical protein